jgi:hypothetical protein
MKKNLKISDRIVDEMFYRGQRIHLYFMLDDGNVYSLIKYQWSWDSNEDDNDGVILKPNISGKSPYPTVKIPYKGKSTTVLLHRLVCENFHGLPKKYPGISSKDWKKTPIAVKRKLVEHMQVNHKDGNPRNYHPDNLEWVTPEQNRDHYHTILRAKRKA